MEIFVKVKIKMSAQVICKAKVFFMLLGSSFNSHISLN